jgi:hypothetical protein
MNRKRIHIRPKRNHFTAFIGFTVDNANDTSAANAFDHFVTAEFFQLRSNNAGCAVGIEQQLGMFMQVAPPSGDIVVKVCKSVDGSHSIPLL